MPVVYAPHQPLLWFNARYATGHKVARQEYERRVSEFFENSLF